MSDQVREAQRFHDIYERLAPNFCCETRAETRVFNPTSSNGRLMIAAVTEFLASVPRPPAITSNRRGLEDYIKDLPVGTKLYAEDAVEAWNQPAPVVGFSYDRQGRLKSFGTEQEALDFIASCKPENNHE